MKLIILNFARVCQFMLFAETDAEPAAQTDDISVCVYMNPIQPTFNFFFTAESHNKFTLIKGMRCDS